MHVYSYPKDNNLHKMTLRTFCNFQYNRCYTYYMNIYIPADTSM